MKSEAQMISVYQAAKRIGIPQKVLNYHIENGNIEIKEGLIKVSDLDIIQYQKNKYIGIRNFLKKFDNERFDSKYAKNRDKYIDFLEVNQYFGIETIDPESILYNFPEKEDFYINKEDIEFLEYKSENFFQNFGLSEKEKIQQLISCAETSTLNKKCVKNYIEFIDKENNIYTPALTSFVNIVFNIKNIKQLTGEDIISIIEGTETIKTKEFLVDFFKYVSKNESVKYHNIEPKKKEPNPAPAYPYETFIRLAKIIFNADYDKRNKLTEKALDNNLYAEMWLYLACHYICGWRSSDICARWIYPNIKDNANAFKINIFTLKEDILNGKISDEIYSKVALYSIRKIEMSYNTPQKTGMGKLRSEIVPELRAFFGKLILIAEYHHITSNEGYMRINRVPSYKNWNICKTFFGDEIFEILGRRSISSTRLNKSYLQGLEQVTREKGNTTLTAHVVAAFARNHANIDTTALYLRDHGLTGETADIVLYMMLQRGVFGVSLYSALIAAYPESFKKLSAKAQTEIIQKLPLSAYEIEALGPSLIATERIIEVFQEGGTEEPKEILKAMFSIAQGSGKAKDAGVFCKRRALGLCCINPQFESCIANLCPYHIFTSEAIPALVKVILDYKRKELFTGDKKYGTVLKKKIIPAFQEIINEILKLMSDEERMGTRKIIEEAFNE